MRQIVLGSALFATSALAQGTEGKMNCNQSTQRDRLWGKMGELKMAISLNTPPHTQTAASTPK